MISAHFPIPPPSTVFAKQINDTARLYDQGWSLAPAWITARMDLTGRDGPTTLTQHGVTTREAQGQTRAGDAR